MRGFLPRCGNPGAARRLGSWVVGDHFHYQSGRRAHLGNSREPAGGGVFIFQCFHVSKQLGVPFKGLGSHGSPTSNGRLDDNDAGAECRLPSADTHAYRIL